jgi:hypothetical protein
MSNASSPLLQQPALQQQEQQQQQPQTTESQVQQLPSATQPHSSGHSSSASGVIEDVNAAALPTPEMSPMDQDKDNFQFSGGTNTNNDDKRSVVAGAAGNALVVGTATNPLSTNIPTLGSAHHQQSSNNVNLSTATTTTPSIGYHHALSQHIPYNRQPSSTSVVSNSYAGTANMLHHHHHHHHHHQTQPNALTATMGLSNGIMMMCTNQRLLDSYEHSGLVTGTFYPPVATSQDNQQLGVGSSGGSSSSSGSSGHQMYTTASSTASPSLGSTYLGSSGSASSTNVYGGNGSGGSGSTSVQGLPASPSGSHYSCNSPVATVHSLRTAEGYTSKYAGQLYALQSNLIVQKLSQYPSKHNQILFIIYNYMFRSISGSQLVLKRINPLKTKCNLVYITTQCEPRSKHSTSVVNIQSPNILEGKVAVCSEVHAQYMKAM